MSFNTTAASAVARSRLLIFRTSLVLGSLAVFAGSCTPQDGRLLSRSNGQRCNESSQCSSGYCQPREDDKEPICCAIECPTGHPCASSGDYCLACQGAECDNDCDLDSEKCRYTQPMGFACGDDSQCATNFCGEDPAGRRLCCNSACAVYGTCDKDGDCPEYGDLATPIKTTSPPSGSTTAPLSTSPPAASSSSGDARVFADTTPSVSPPSSSEMPSPVAFCGDGIVSGGEECDNDPTCNDNCEWIICGDGRTDDGEECDPPTPGKCTSACTEIRCGNGRYDEGETCEPPEASFCNDECLEVRCGDGRADESDGEECDPPQVGSCSSMCKRIVCGNSIQEEGEGCDPPLEGVCDETCHPYGCGDGVKDPGEECDPPTPGKCDGQCREIGCGNGRRDDGEECDASAGDVNCSVDCLEKVCGNGRKDEGEECDPPHCRFLQQDVRSDRLRRRNP